MANGWRKMNHLIVIGEVIKSFKVEIRDGLGNFFANHLKTKYHVRVDLDNVGLKNISREVADDIAREFMVDEGKTAVFMMTGDKTLVPKGFQFFSRNIKKSW